MKGRLILLPVGIGADDLATTLPAYNYALMNGCRTFIVEELRTARRFLKKAGYPYPIDDTQFFVLNEHTTDITHYLDPIEQGEDIGLLSEAGLPCVADPGARVTREAQRRGIEVIPLVGPSSVMLTLMASGLNGQNFAFVGYLPIERQKRIDCIRHLEDLATRHNQTQLFIEAPYRNNQLLEVLANTLHDHTQVCIGCDLTMPTQQIITLEARTWRKRRNEINLHKRNTVFAIGR